MWIMRATTFLLPTPLSPAAKYGYSTGNRSADLPGESKTILAAWRAQKPKDSSCQNGPIFAPKGLGFLLCSSFPFLP